MKAKSIHKLMFVAALIGAANISLAFEGTWTRKADMPTPRVGPYTAVVDGKIYAIGGGPDITGGYLSTVEEYDPTTDTWTRKANMPTARNGHATAMLDGKIYVIAGEPRAQASIATVEEYDPATDTWTQKADMPSRRTFLSASTVDGKIYAFGGVMAGVPEVTEADRFLSALEVYDPATDTWTRGADMMTPRAAAAAVTVDGKIYVIGGVFGNLHNAPLSIVEAYDPITDTWTRKANMPTARMFLSASVVGGRIYAMGGGVWGGAIYSTVEVYDPATDTWTSESDMPTARGTHASCAVSGKIYAIGGSREWYPGPGISTVEEYDLTPPPHDFNGDYLINIEDLILLIEHWNQGTLLCDIAPPPFGDGLVDIADLELFMSYWEPEFSTEISEIPEWTIYDTSNSGLPYNGVTALDIDEQGNAWIGTGRWWAHAGGGLAKFDGTNWTVYNTSNSQLPNNDHVSLSIDSDGNIWSGTENGLSKFDRVNWTVYKTNNSGLPSNRTGAPAFDAEGNAWIATFSNGGLAKFDGENWTVYRTGNSGLPSNNVADVAIDAQGNIWVSTLGSGVAKFDGQNWTVYNRTNSGLPHNDTSFLSIDGQGNVWIGTYGGGLGKFDGDTWTAYNSANSGLPDNWIWNLKIDPEGNVWAGTKAGLAKFDGVNWTVFNTSNSSLPDNNVYCVAFDARGNVWIGTQSGGLVVYWQPPVIDFNGDGIVDSADMCMMIDYWGTDEPMYDIAPLPSGDGIVDVQDLILLSEHLFEEIFPPELIAYWKFDETEGVIAFELAGGKDGYLFGDPVWQPEEGIKQGALQFDGVNDYVLTTFDFNPAQGPFSVFAWIKGGSPGQAIISQMDGTGSGETWLGIDAVHGCLMTGLVPTPVGRFVTQPLESNNIITDDIWHHIGFVWDGSYRSLYVDGVQVASDATVQNPLKSANGGLYIGVDKTLNASTFFSGLLDDIRIYDKALSAEEIENLTQ